MAGGGRLALLTEGRVAQLPPALALAIWRRVSDAHCRQGHGINRPRSEVTKNFELYQGRALHAPVLVTEHGQPSAVILAADEYEQLLQLDRQALSITELE
jgi:hypothetical protein